MSPRDQLNSYIRQLEKRLHLEASIRGAAILASAALVATLVVVLVANAFAFSGWSIVGGRFFLLCAVGAAAAAGLALPLLRLTRRRAATKAESVFPGFQQRLITYVERDNAHEPFVDLLAADTLEKTRGFDPAGLVSNRSLGLSLGASFVAVGALVWVIAAGPGFLGYGSSLLWLGKHITGAPIYEIRVTPGNASVRRNSDELVTAQPIGFSTSQIHLYARYDSATKWNELSMKPQSKGSGFQFVFAGLPEGVAYYAKSGAVRSREFHISVVDLPSVKKIQATYQYPSWTGWKDAADKHGGDLHAVQGTTAKLSIQTDRPLKNGVLVLSDGHRIPLTGGKNDLYQASVPMTKNGAYHVAAVSQGQPVRLTEDYFIEADKANAPQVQIVRPTQDYRASPIEEVTINAKAADEYGLKAFTLHYSVNGGPEKTIDLLKHSGAKQADGSTVLSMEKFKAVPGDVVAYYATAKDARTTSHSGIDFIQARPFELDYSQSQQAGGGGGGRSMGSQAQISQREKELIASTWNQRNAQNPSAKQSSDEAKFLSQAQSELQKQAEALAGRMQLRDLNQQNQSFGNFQDDMNAAAKAMGPASQKLGRQQWQQALPDEQKALQHLLQAEATFRRIQVAFGNGGGGGGGGANAGRDLAGLFDLELDTQKNQYETAQSASSSHSQQNSQKVDDALRKLDQLARQQQNLANQQQASNSQNFQQRWQQEILHRNIQQLQQQLQQLEQSLQQQQSQQGSASSSSSSSSSSGQSSSASSSQAGANSNIQRAINALHRADQALSQTGTQSQNSAANARNAANALREASNALGALQGQQASGSIDSMARKAQQLQAQQQAQAKSLQRLSQSQSSAQAYQQAQSLADQRQKLADGLSGLEQQMRNAARQLAPTQPNAASKLRNALGNVDQADLATQIQRDADWLRQGYAPDPASESQITSQLQQLANNLRQAQSALGPAQSPNSQTQNALNNAQQLRNQVQALQRALRAGNRANGQGRSGQQGRQGQGQQGQGQQGQGRQGQGRQGQSGQGQGQGRQGQMARGGQPGRTGSGPIGGLDRPTPGGGPVNSRIYQGYNGSRQRNGGVPYGNIDTGGQKYTAGQLPPPGNAPVSGDPEAVFQQYVNTLNQLQRSVQQDPQLAREVQNLVRQMQGLNPRRFPGNPQVYNQMAGQALSAVDKIELQLRNKLNSKDGQIRSTSPTSVPPGYQNSVAEYFRRLSQGH